MTQVEEDVGNEQGRRLAGVEKMADIAQGFSVLRTGIVPVRKGRHSTINVRIMGTVRFLPIRIVILLDIPTTTHSGLEDHVQSATNDVRENVEFLPDL